MTEHRHPPPVDALRAVGAERWPDDPAARRALSGALYARKDREAWRALVTWAWAEHHDEAAGGSRVPAVAELLGISRPRLFAWRAEDPDGVGALPATRVKRLPGTAIRGDTRAAREAGRGKPRGRPPKARQSPPESVPAPSLPPWLPAALRSRLGAFTAAAPSTAPAATLRAMLDAYDTADSDVRGVTAAVDALDAAGVSAGEASAAARAFLEARVG